MGNEMKPRRRQRWATAFRKYVDFINKNIYWRRVHAEGIENMPADGNPIVLVSNHQNCLNDPLTLALLLKDRRPNFLARANVFAVHPLVNKFLRALGLLPAYRVQYEGLSAVRKNQGTLSEVDNALRSGETVILYPECGHQDKRWLGNFSLAYLKMAFGAAEASGFEKEVFVMPTANHYSHYYHAREDMMIRFGEPISLAPYYDLYKEQPRAAMRQVNEIVRAKIEELMLNINDLENYEEIDYLRESRFGEQFAEAKGLNPDLLPDKLRADKALVAGIEQAKEQNPEEVEKLFDKTRKLIKGIKELGIRDWLFEGERSRFKQIWQGVLLLLGLPLFVACIIPTALMFIVPAIFIKKFIKDQMFHSSINVGATAFITYPICCLIPTIVMICTGAWIKGLIYFVAFPLFFIYAWNYIRWTVKYVGQYRFILPRNRKKVEQMRALRSQVFNKLGELLKATSQAL